MSTIVAELRTHNGELARTPGAFPIHARPGDILKYGNKLFRITTAPITWQSEKLTDESGRACRGFMPIVVVEPMTRNQKGMPTTETTTSPAPEPAIEPIAPMPVVPKQRRRRKVAPEVIPAVVEPSPPVVETSEVHDVEFID